MAKNKTAGTDRIDDLTFHSLFNVLQAGMWLQNDIEKFLAPYGLSHGRFSIMLAILENGSESVVQHEIALFMGRSKPTITKMIKTLEKDGLVENTGRGSDGRTKQIRLTAAGNELLQQIIPEYNKRLLKISSHLTIADKTQLMSLLAKLEYPEHGQKIGVFHV